MNHSLAVAIHRAGFGTFNSADAGITAHRTYNHEKEIYTMDFYYYLIDFYDYSHYNFLQDQDALGYFRSFELYGKEHHEVIWAKDHDIFWIK